MPNKDDFTPSKVRCSFCGKTLKAIEKDTERDHFMTAEQAKEYGLIDEIIAPRR